jgi:callose synthase
MPKEQQVNESFLPSRFRNFWQRLQLRYGFSRSFRKIESNQVEAQRFAVVWNEIIIKFQEEDIVSDHNTFWWGNMNFDLFLQLYSRL